MTTEPITKGRSWISTLIGAAGEPTGEEDSNVVRLRRPAIEARAYTIRQVQDELRGIHKEGAALEARYDDATTRLTNARAALCEQLGELGIVTVGMNDKPPEQAP